MTESDIKLLQSHVNIEIPSQRISLTHYKGSVLLPFNDRSPLGPCTLSALCIHVCLTFCQQLQHTVAFQLPFSLVGCKHHARFQCEISAWLELHLPGGLSCPTEHPLQPGQTWQRWCPHSCWRPWWRCWCAHPWDCNTLHSHLAPSDQSTSRSLSLSQPVPYANKQTWRKIIRCSVPLGCSVAGDKQTWLVRRLQWWATAKEVSMNISGMDVRSSMLSIFSPRRCRSMPCPWIA